MLLSRVRKGLVLNLDLDLGDAEHSSLERDGMVIPCQMYMMVNSAT